MIQHGFVRVAAAVPRVRVADCGYNVTQIAELLDHAESQRVHVVVFPELAITGYSCADLFQQPTLLDGARDALASLLDRTRDAFAGLAVVGLPWAVDDQLYNCAAVFQRGRLLGVVPKTYLPTYKEFYEARWFAPGDPARAADAAWLDTRVPFGTDLLFDAGQSAPGLVVGVEICEDLWSPIPPSAYQALAGAKVLLNLSASNEVIGKTGYRRQLVLDQSGRCIAGYVYTSCGPLESTTDLVFGGHAMIADNGNLLAETPRFQRENVLLASDIDFHRLHVERLTNHTFGATRAAHERPWRRVAWRVERSPTRLLRKIDPHPFVPRASAQLRARCEDIFHTQVAGLAKRLEHVGRPPVTIGVSGGLDSTLALLVACKTFDLLDVPRTQILGYTMPGFGTTQRTRTNAHDLMRHLGVADHEVDIRPLCLEEMRALGHKPFGIALDGLTVETFAARLRDMPVAEHGDLVFENVQARMRTSLLMNRGFVVGTGDLSELALGWCTYNADHMSMYNPNVSIPKTLVKFLVRWAAENEFTGAARRTLLDVVGTQISPELLPTTAKGEIAQLTEAVIGPYELHDFFLFHFLRYGAPPDKILFLAGHAEFEQSYPPDERRRWLRVFLQRFFASQYKRSCLPDGPKVGTVSLSPRGDWRMPSDADAALWLKETESAAGAVGRDGGV
jgi:NAD+ synthase (glutamine-hydrolysing)